MKKNTEDTDVDTKDILFLLLCIFIFGIVMIISALLVYYYVLKG